MNSILKSVSVFFAVISVSPSFAQNPPVDTVVALDKGTIGIVCKDLEGRDHILYGVKGRDSDEAVKSFRGCANSVLKNTKDAGAQAAIPADSGSGARTGAAEDESALDQFVKRYQAFLLFVTDQETSSKEPGNPGSLY